MPRWNYNGFQDRFWCKVNQNGILVDGMESRCWDWIGGIQTDGYGSMGMCIDGKWACWPAHRVSWLIYYGSLPKYPEEEICHKCDNRKCVNPTHLFIASHVENIRDMFKKNRSYDRSGHSNPNAKLTYDTVQTIRNLYLSGNYTFRKLGKMFGVSGTHIGYIVKQKSWKE